jgi:hypothetical protein
MPGSAMQQGLGSIIPPQGNNQALQNLLAMRLQRAQEMQAANAAEQAGLNGLPPLFRENPGMFNRLFGGIENPHRNRGRIDGGGAGGGNR